VATGKAIRRFEGHKNTVTGAVFHPDGRTILSVSPDFSLRSWDLETGEQIRWHDFNSMPDSLVISPDGRIALLSVESELHQWDVGRWREIGRFLGHTAGDNVRNQVDSIAISPDGRLALSGSTAGALRLWNLEGQAEFRRFETDSTPISAVAVSPDGGYLLTGDATGDAILWDVEGGKAIRRFEGDGIPVCPDCVAFSPDGRQVLVGAEDVFGDSGATSLVLWDVEIGEEIRRFEGHVTYVRSLAFSPDGRTVLSGSQSLPLNTVGDLVFWDIETGREIRRFDITHDVANIAFSADGSRALTGSASQYSLILWDVATGREIHRFEGHEGPVLAVAFGPEETSVLSASVDGSLILWDVETGEVIRRYLGHEQAVWGLDVSPDGRYTISGSDDATVILWDFETGEELRRFSEHTASVLDVVFSPDSQAAFSVSLDGALIQWQIADLPLDELIEWVHANRYVRELTCDERAQYRVEPLCEIEGSMSDTDAG
jgi:WD40 repeat protein